MLRIFLIEKTDFGGLQTLQIPEGVRNKMVSNKKNKTNQTNKKNPTKTNKQKNTEENVLS